MTWVRHGREEILVANVDGTLYAIDNVCSHSGGSLADGWLTGTTVICPLHTWQYDLVSGCCTHIRDECLRKYEVVVEGEDIFVEVTG